MKMRYILIVTMILVYTGCSINNNSEKVTRISLDSFTEKIVLNHEVVDYGPINNPRHIKVIDTLLVVLNTKTDFFLDIYNLNTGKLIGQYIPKGKGPNEMIYMKWIQKINDSKTLFTQCSQTKKIIKINISDSDFTLNDIEINDKGAINTQYVNGGFIGFSHQFENVNRLYYYNEQGDIIDQKGEYPKDFPKVGNGLDAHIAEAALTIKPDESKIAIAYSNADLIEIYSIKGELLKQITGPDFFNPMFEVQNNNGFTSVTWDKEQKTAYMQVVSDNEFIYALYSGKLNVHENYLSNTEIFKFNWEGNPVALYQLDKAIFDFDVYKNELYGFSYTDQLIYKFER